MPPTLPDTTAISGAVAGFQGARTSIDEHLGSARTGTTRTERSRRTRVALVAAVRDELRETGAFTADTVAARAGCSVATFYSHFATKDDALASAFELVLVDLATIIESTFTSQTLSTTGLAAVVGSWVDRQIAFFRAESLVFRAALARLPFHRGIRHAYREAERIALLHLTAVISEAQAHSLIRGGPSEELAEAFLVLSQGLNNPHALRQGAEPLRSHLTRALVAALEPAGGAQ